MVEDFLSERIRAEDIILGSLGYGEDAKIISIEKTKDGFRGTASWPDGENFSIENDDELDNLQQWALTVLLRNAS